MARPTIFGRTHSTERSRAIRRPAALNGARRAALALGLWLTCAAVACAQAPPDPALAPTTPPAAETAAPAMTPLGTAAGPSTASGAYAQAPLTARPPVIDGGMREPVWDEALLLTNFIALNGEHRAVRDTEVRVLWDAEKLYIGFRCKDKDLVATQAGVTQRDDPAIYDEDCVEVFIDGSGSRSDYIHLVVNRRGAILDEVGLRKPEEHDLAGVEVDAGALSWAWDVEIAIPFSELGITGAPGTAFTANFARRRALDGEKSSWTLCRGSFRDPYSFGELALATAPTTVQVFDLGDSYGELRGGANVKLRFSAQAPTVVAPSVTLVGGGFTRTFETVPPDAPASVINAAPSPVSLDGKHPKKVEIPYYVLSPNYTLCQVKLYDQSGQTVLYRSPMTPLHNTWLKPRLEQMTDALASYTAYLATVPPTDPAAAVRSEIASLQTQCAAVNEMIESKDQYGGVNRWQQIRDAMVAIDQKLSPIGLKMIVAKGRTAAEVAAGSMPSYALSGRDWMETATYRTVPDIDDVKPAAYCYASPGETEPLTVLVTTTQELTGCTASVTDFVENSPATPATGSFPAAQADIRVVRCWLQAGAGRLREEGARVFTPELLVVDETEPTGLLPDVRVSGPVNFTAGGAQALSRQIWVDVTVPPDAAPGLYESTLTVTPQNAPPRSIKLLVKVLGLRLVEPTQKWMVFFHNALAGEGAIVVDKTLYETYLKDVAAHGFDQATVADSAEKLLEGLQLRKSLGLDAPAVVSLYGVKPEEAGAFVSTLERLFEGKDVPELWFYTFADPRNREQLDVATGLAETIQGAGGKTTTTITPLMAAEHGDSLDVPIYSIYDSDFENYIVGVLKAELTPDPRPEYYHYVGTLEDPAYNRLLCGFYLEKVHLDGVFVSSYQDPVGASDPYSDASAQGAFRPQMLTYPTRNGPIPTIQWQAAREGRDDMRYLATLQSLIELGMTHQTSPGVAEALKSARDALLLLTRTVQVDWRYDVAGIAPDFYGKMRWDIAVKALRLQEALQAAGVSIAPTSPTTNALDLAPAAPGALPGAPAPGETAPGGGTAPETAPML